MKRILIIASAALVAMCACTKNNADVVVGQDQEVTFEVANYLSQTKADELSYYSDGHFGTFAFQIAEGEEWASATTKNVFMNNVDIYYQTSVWKALKSYYWPKTGSLTFASYSPLDSKSACGAKASCGTDAVVKITGWSVNTDESAQNKDYTEDLMWADVIADQTNNNGEDQIFTEGVKTLFHHSLAKINLNAMMTPTAETSAYDFAIYVTKVIVDGLEYKGDYTVGAGWGNRSTDRAGDAAIYTNTADYAVGDEYEAGTDVLGTDADSAVALIEDYFVLPQTLADASTIEIEYTVVTIDPETGKVVLVEPTTTEPIKINDMGLEAWGENKNITYTVTIAPTQETPILFDPAVVDWVIESPATLEL